VGLFGNKKKLKKAETKNKIYKELRPKNVSKKRGK